MSEKFAKATCSVPGHGMWCGPAHEKADGIRERASSFRRKADKATSIAGYDEWIAGYDEWIDAHTDSSENR